VATGTGQSVLYFSKSPDARAPLPAETLYMTKPAGAAAPTWSGIQRTALLGQPPAGGLPMAGGTEESARQIQLEPPGLERVSRVESEASLQERIRQETRDITSPDRPIERIQFPTEPVLSAVPFQGRAFAPMREVVEPNYVCYGRLHFEQKNFERYGWDLGPVTPFLSAGAFFWDVAWLPYHMGTDPCRKYECNAGYCLPGDPVPFMLYPPEFSVSGLAAETVAVVSLLYIFP
jgi:hypothetical protein